MRSRQRQCHRQLFCKHRMMGDERRDGGENFGCSFDTITFLCLHNQVMLHDLRRLLVVHCWHSQWQDKVFRLVRHSMNYETSRHLMSQDFLREFSNDFTLVPAGRTEILSLDFLLLWRCQWLGAWVAELVVDSRCNVDRLEWKEDMKFSVLKIASILTFYLFLFFSVRRRDLQWE